MIPADYLTWSRHLLVSCPFFRPHLSPPPWMVKADPEMLTIPLKECRRRIAWPYSRVLWPPPCAACGEGGQEMSAPARHGLSDGKAAQEFLEDRLQRKDPSRSSQGIHSRSEWPAYRRGRWGTTGDHSHATSLGERVWGLFLKTAPARDQQKPRAVLLEKHVN